MTWSFTAAAERALAEAAGWSSRDDRDDLAAPELLVGLLAEPECRAAEILLARGVDIDRIRAQWPSLRPIPDHARREFSPDLLSAFEAAVDRLWEYPRPLALATEHLLLGLAAAPGETAEWLASCGVDPRQLEELIHRLNGHEPGPLPVDIEASVSPPEPTPDSHAADAPTRQTTKTTPPTAPAASSVSTPTNTGELTLVDAGIAAILRVVDAAGNRAREGLRVVEDYSRMILDDRFLTGALKQLRHDLQRAMELFATADLLACRDTIGDVGTTASTSAEFDRADASAVAAANFKRLAEALRSVEEFGKVVAPQAAAAIEQLRYRVYTLERAADVTRTSNERLALVRLCVLIDGRTSEANFGALIDLLVSARVPMIQLRDKSLDDIQLAARARLLRERTATTDTMAIINDRADIAAAVQADGVHLGQEDLSVAAARRIVGPRMLIGRSTHSIEQARQAVLDGANYIGVGPTFPSGTKRFAAFPGTALLREVAAEIRLPALAIGGITLDNLDDVLEAGSTRVAVSGAITGAAEPGAAATEFGQRLSAIR